MNHILGGLRVHLLIKQAAFSSMIGFLTVKRFAMYLLATINKVICLLAKGMKPWSMEIFPLLPLP